MLIVNNKPGKKYVIQIIHRFYEKTGNVREDISYFGGVIMEKGNNCVPLEKAVIFPTKEMAEDIFKKRFSYRRNDVKIIEKP